MPVAEAGELGGRYLLCDAPPEEEAVVARLSPALPPVRTAAMAVAPSVLAVARVAARQQLAAGAGEAGAVS